MLNRPETKGLNISGHEARELLQAVLHVSPVGICFAKNRTMLWTNPSLEKMLGYGPDELRKKSTALLYPSKEEFNRIGRQLYAMMGKEGLARINSRWVRKDGREIECVLHAYPTDKNNPKNGCVVTAAVDRSGQLKTEAALCSEQERFRVLVEETPVSIAIIDSRGRYQYINPEFTNVFGYTLADIPTGRQWFQMAFPEPGYRQKVISAWIGDLKHAATHRDRHRTFQVTCKTGEKKTIRFRPVAMSTGDHLVLSLDITQQKRLEAQLLQAQRMEAMGTLAGGVAHDFNNILGAILGYAELAQIKAPAELEEVQYSLDNILKAGHRARELVKQILSFSRHRDQVMTPVQIVPIMKEVLKLLRATLPATIDIRLKIDAPRGTVLADPTKIHQMLMNLCTNASHAMAEQGGVLELGLTLKEMDSQAVAGFPELHPGAHLVLAVKDTGCGVPPEAAKRIFTPYYTTKGKNLGTGLGLAVVQSIVQCHGGAVRLTSTVGTGSEFSVFLPAFQGEMAAAPPPAGPLPKGSERILFVDDENALADLGMRILQHLGYRVCAQTDSMKALEVFRADPHAFSLVITDMAMPRMAGDRLAQKILKVRKDVPIILSTGFSERISEQKAAMIGIRDVIMKPLVIHKLAHIIRKHLDG